MATLYLVSTPIGNLSDLSERASSTLGSVERVFAEDTRRTRVLLDHLGLPTRTTSLHAHNESARVREVVGQLDRGSDVAIVTDAGTPLVSDPGERVVAAAVEAGHRVVPVPGPSAVLAALVGSGLPADRFAFLGFAPRKGEERRRFVDRVAMSDETIVAFESPERLEGLLADLEEACGCDRRVAVARELTKVHEDFVRGTFAEARAYYHEWRPRGEVTVVIEPAPRAEEPDEVDEVAARKLAEALLGDGARPSHAARELTRRLGLPRNYAYRIVHSVPVDAAADPPGSSG